MIRFFALVLISSSFFSCGSDDDSPPPAIMTSPPQSAGLTYLSTVNSPAAAYTSLINLIAGFPGLELLADVEHSAQADAIDIELRLTRSLYFDAPAISIPILADNQLAALDLPQQMVVYRAITGETYLAFTAAGYFQDRYGTPSNTLRDYELIMEDLMNLAANDDAPFENPSTGAGLPGIISQSSNQDFATTYSSLVQAITNTLDQEIYAEIDFEQRAFANSLELRPTRLLIFGNPNWDIPLLRASQIACIDIPHKMLVWEAADGSIQIAYNDMDYLAARHGISLSQEEVGLLNNLLASVALEAAGM